MSRSQGYLSGENDFLPRDDGSETDEKSEYYSSQEPESGTQVDGESYTGGIENYNFTQKEEDDSNLGVEVNRLAYSICDCKHVHATM
jgi:hypothetical protein